MMNITPKIALESIHFMQNSQLKENPLAKKILNIALPILAVLFALWAFRDTISNYFQVKQINSNVNANSLMQQVNPVMIMDFSDQIQDDIFSKINVSTKANPTNPPQRKILQSSIDDIQSAKLFISLKGPSNQAPINVEKVMKRSNGQGFDIKSFKEKLSSIFNEDVQNTVSSCFQTKSDIVNCKITWKIIMKLKNDDFSECSKSYSLGSSNYSENNALYTKDQFSKMNAELPTPIVDSQMEFI